MWNTPAFEQNNLERNLLYFLHSFRHSLNFDFQVVDVACFFSFILSTALCLSSRGRINYWRRVLARFEFCASVNRFGLGSREILYIQFLFGSSKSMVLVWFVLHEFGLFLKSHSSSVIRRAWISPLLFVAIRIPSTPYANLLSRNRDTTRTRLAFWFFPNSYFHLFRFVLR